MVFVLKWTEFNRLVEATAAVWFVTIRDLNFAGPITVTCFCHTVAVGYTYGLQRLHISTVLQRFSIQNALVFEC